MGRNRRLAGLGCAVALLASCASRPAAPPRSTPASSQQGLGQNLPGRADMLAGRTAQALASLFGQPALDVREGNARKLQFLNDSCVLDAYLYARGRGEAVVTHVDARLPDGRDADKAACVAALQRR